MKSCAFLLIAVALFSSPHGVSAAIQNIAPINGVATASGYCCSRPPINAIDADALTLWNDARRGTPSNPSWLVVDLQSLFSVSKVYLQSPDIDGINLGYSNVYNFYVSDDGENWTFIASGTLYDSNDPEEYSDTIFIPQAISVFRYAMYEVVGGTHWGHLGEMEIYADVELLKLRSYYDVSKKFVFSKKFIEQTPDHVTAKVRLISGSGCWYMATPNFEQPGSPISKADVYYLAPYDNILIDGNLRFEAGQYYQLDIDRGNVGAQTLIALDVILRGIFSKRLEDVITKDKEKISLFINVIEESGRVSGLDAGTAYLLNGEYMDATKQYLKVMKELADLIGHDKMQKLFTSVVGRSGKVIWNRGVKWLLEVASLPDKVYLFKEIIDNYVTNPCPLDGYVRLRAK